MSREFFTVVFQIKDKAAFHELCGQFTGAMAEDTIISGAKVTAAGWCDAMTEVDHMRDWIDREGGDADAIARGEE